MTECLDEINFSDARFKISVSVENRIFSSYFYLPDQFPPEGIGRMRVFFDIWHAKIKNTNLPGWKDFSFEDFKGWHSNMRLIKCGEMHDRADEVLIVGESFAQLWGRESLSEKIREGQVLSSTTISKFHQYLEHLYNHEYAVSIGRLPLEGISYQSILFLDLPLSNNGNEVTHVISAILPLKR